MEIKKILLISALFSFLFILIVPLVALAQEKPIECCRLGNTIVFEGVTYNSGIWVGEKSCTGGTISLDCTATSGTQTNCYTPKWGLLCLLNTLYIITDWIFFILVALSTVMVSGGAFLIVTAGGDPSKVSTGQQYITYAMIGLMVALLSRAFPALVKALIG